MDAVQNKTTTLYRVYLHVNTALWAGLLALMVMVVLSIPRMRDAQIAIAQQRAQELAQESASYCAKWGLGAGTPAHASCTRDLDDVRANVTKRMADDSLL